MAVNQLATVAGTNMIGYRKAFATANALPAAAAYGVAWTGYTDIGYTREGMHFGLEQQQNDIVFDQDLDPALIIPQSRAISVQTRMGEITGANLQTAAGLPSSALASVAAGTGTRGTDTVSIVGNISLNYYTFGFEVQGQDNEALQVLLKKGLSRGNITLDFVRNDPALINVDFRAIPDTVPTPKELAFFRDISAAL